MKFSHCAIFERESRFILPLAAAKITCSMLKLLQSFLAKYLFYFIEYQINNV